MERLRQPVATTAKVWLVLAAQPERSGLESGVHETSRRRDGGWSPDGSAGVHEADLRRRHREDVWAPVPDAGRRGAGGADPPQRRPWRAGLLRLRHLGVARGLRALHG